MVEELKRHILDLGLRWEPKGMIIGCRNFRDRGIEEGRKFNDVFVCVRADRIIMVPGTTDPGIPLTLLKNRPSSWLKGCAHYESNQQARFARHEHLGHPAFRPLDAMMVWRDANANYVRDPNEPSLRTHSDLFIHAPHRGPDRGPQKEIGRSSAGCQVTQRVSGMLELYRFIVETPGRFSPGLPPAGDPGWVLYSIIDHYLIPQPLRSEIFGA